MPNIRDIPGLIDPNFIDNGLLSDGGGDIHISGEVFVNAIRIGEDVYEVGNLFINGNGDIIGTK